MKKTILFTLALMLSAATFAQQQLATLNHNDSITVFYGVSALQQAHAAAVSGDIITLSSGSFNAVNVTKAISIRGAGMYNDTLAGSAPTMVIGDFSVDIPNDSIKRLFMEGVNIANSITYYTLYNPQFLKCYIEDIRGYSNSAMHDASFINCIINKWENGFNLIGNSYYINTWELREGAQYAPGTSFINSVVLWVHSSARGEEFHNCVLIMNRQCAQYKNLDNCVVIGRKESTGYTSRWGVNNGNSIYSFNSIGIEPDESDTIYFASATNHNLHNFGSFSPVFKTFQGAYSDGETFELQDSIVSTILGSDGTQVGIYGGSMPFDPYVRHPLVRRCNVASRSTADGKLAVDIEIVSE